jgi:deazaflavin-dependent oxidoreductase (nitroreductase family)
VVVKHIGRKSGRPYETPVIAHAVGDGFIIALPYGDDVDWCRNILAADGCTITRGGVEHRVDAPQILDPSRALPELPRALPGGCSA